MSKAGGAEGGSRGSQTQKRGGRSQGKRGGRSQGKGLGAVRGGRVGCPGLTWARGRSCCWKGCRAGWTACFSKPHFQVCAPWAEVPCGCVDLLPWSPSLRPHYSQPSHASATSALPISMVSLGNKEILKCLVIIKHQIHLGFFFIILSFTSYYNIKRREL